MDRTTQNRLKKIRAAEERLAFASPTEAAVLSDRLAKWKAGLFY